MFSIRVLGFGLKVSLWVGGRGGGGAGEGVVYANAYDIKKKPPEILVVSDKHLIPRLFTSYL